MSTFTQNTAAVALAIVGVVVVAGLVLLAATGAEIPDALSAAAGAVVGVLGKTVADQRK